MRLGDYIQTTKTVKTTHGKLRAGARGEIIAQGLNWATVQLRHPHEGYIDLLEAEFAIIVKGDSLRG
jgi:hypothetical protein